MPSGWPGFNVWLKDCSEVLQSTQFIICVRQFITTSTERNFRNFVSHLTSNLPPKHVTVSQTPCDIISFNCQGQP